MFKGKGQARASTASAVADLAVGGDTHEQLMGDGPSMVQLKILLGVSQITCELPNVLELKYPDRFADLLVGARVLIVDIFSVFKLDCISPLSLHAKFIVIMLLPPFCIGIVQLLRMWSDCRATLGDASTELLAERKAASHGTAAYRSSFIIIALYPLLTRSCFRMYDCQYLGSDEGWHPDDFKIACDDPTHVVFIALASVGVCIYPIGIPLSVLLMLWRDAKKTGEDASSSLDFLRIDCAPVAFCNVGCAGVSEWRCGCLPSDKAEFYYYECVTLIEKVR